MLNIKLPSVTYKSSSFVFFYSICLCLRSTFQSYQLAVKKRKHKREKTNNIENRKEKQLNRTFAKRKKERKKIGKKIMAHRRKTNKMRQQH